MPTTSATSMQKIHPLGSFDSLMDDDDDEISIVLNTVNKFFQSGSPLAIFLDSFVRVQGSLPVTAGPIHGLLRASDIWKTTNKHKPTVLNEVESPTELDPTDDVSDVFPKTPPKKTIHVIIRRPPSIHAPVPVPLHARSSTPLLDDSRPGTLLSGDLHSDIKKITDKFFAPGSDVAKFLDAFMGGQGALPTATGPILGLSSARRRGFGHPPETLSFI
ncbi:hypothetical protein KI688_010530 [Linnemannia hyalina]|uniref:Uncharacterized protein n=1 Tax=Linnemannia hyalina TaxID=64524 RepID=A0A9P8BVX7_9FUNG|nr:hypothetical protein KI688_010530 [Linnemannia hyalina]